MLRADFLSSRCFMALPSTSLLFRSLLRFSRFPLSTDGGVSRSLLIFGMRPLLVCERLPVVVSAVHTQAKGPPSTPATSPSPAENERCCGCCPGARLRVTGLCATPCSRRCALPVLAPLHTSVIDVRCTDLGEGIFSTPHILSMEHPSVTIS